MKQSTTVTEAYYKAKAKPSDRNKVTKSGQGSGRPKKSSGDKKGPWDNIGRGLKTAGSVAVGAAKGMTVDPVKFIAKNPKEVGKTLVNPKKLANWGVDNLFAGKEVERILRGKGSKMDAGLAALSVIPIGGKGASKSLKELAEQASKGAVASGAEVVAKRGAKKAAGKVKAATKKTAKETPAVAKKLDEVSKIGGDKAGVAKRLREATPRVKKEIARDNVPQVLPVKRVSQSATAAEKKILSKGKSATAKPTVNRTGYVPPAKVKSSPWDKNIAMSMKYNLPEEVKPVRAAKRQGPKVDTTPKAGSVPKKKPAKSVAATAKTADVSEGALAQKRVADARANLNAFKAQHGASYRTKRGYTKLANAVTRAEQGVNTSRRIGAPRPQRGVTQTTMTNTRVNAGDAQRTYSRIGRSKTPRNGMTESPKPSKGQYEGDLLRGQARDDAARMSNRGLRGSKRATRDGRTAENKAKNVQNITIRENNRKIAKYEEKRQLAIKSKKPKDIEAAKKYAEFWGLKGIKRLK